MSEIIDPKEVVEVARRENGETVIVDVEHRDGTHEVRVEGPFHFDGNGGPVEQSKDNGVF